ncbi:hypothetical protein JAAARDRAFT_30226 [Jaapia argillacea MUCL 33604]|uniref:AN1-type domain-containing protein n=1 Tax=Jaapia argillacea MUCL 33604 TaxID=933084 RepID=A0A067Q5J8_9AGAM|nr:hypothetical protein JAAARDRAFT_30226 [Jaapia argillacea MUCL 33604]
MSNTSERDTTLLSIGTRCSDSRCGLVDFLPFKCQHCSQSYCQEHYLPDKHSCEKYDEAKVNRVAPSCPLCNTPVAIPPGQDPNIRMEKHINTECSVMTGKSGKTKSSPTCDRARCGKILFAPIRCDKCAHQFCPSHRFPKDHNCSSLSTPSTSKPSASNSSTSLPPNPLAGASAASAAAMAAIKRSIAPSPSTSSPSRRQPQSPTTSTSASGSGSQAKSGPSNPFSGMKQDSLPRLTTTNASTKPNLASNDNDPPARCSPKSPTSSSSGNPFINAASFIPPPLFASV